jgi:ElaB/YqjD/DUF883 family membrane-anchored ribosome-binding protein
MANEAVERTHSTPTKMAEKMAERGERMGQKLDDIASEAQDLYGRGRDRALVWKDSMIHYVQDQPMKSVLIAAGVGLILGAILTRR